MNIISFLLFLYRLSKKIKVFKNELESERNGDKNINDESLIWSFLCSNPVHVFQLIFASDIITKDVIPFLKEDAGTFEVNVKY